MSNARSSNVVEALERSWPRTRAQDELRLPWEFLTFLRVAAVNKVAGLSRQQAAATPLPASPVLSVLGVIKHLTVVERWWLSTIGSGLDVPQLWDDDDTNAEFRPNDQDTPVAVGRAYRAEWRRSEEALAEGSPRICHAVRLTGNSQPCGGCWRTWYKKPRAMSASGRIT